MKGMEEQTKPAKTTASDLFPIIIMGGLFVLIDFLALWITGPFEAAGQVAFVNPGDPFNLVFFFGVVIVFTAIILLIARWGKARLIQAIFLGSTGLLGIYVFYPLLGYVFPQTVANDFLGTFSPISLGLSVAIMAVIVGLLIKFPEWYVVDISGIIIAVGAIAMIGISLTILIVVALLAGMAIYDFISVYKTKHMIDLADTLVDLKLPILFVIPRTAGYSLIRETKRLKEKLAEGEKRDAFFMGVGDIVIPGILVAAAFHNIAGNGLAIGVSVIAGTLVGFAALMTFVVKGKPQAGLPFLCPGAILGYVVSSLILTGGLAGLSLAL
jgi:presenilin-like A22 family membrane protease